jgi:ribonuclease I
MSAIDLYRERRRLNDDIAALRTRLERTYLEAERKRIRAEIAAAETRLEEIRICISNDDEGRQGGLFG